MQTNLLPPHHTPEPEGPHVNKTETQHTPTLIKPTLKRWSFFQLNIMTGYKPSGHSLESQHFSMLPPQSLQSASSLLSPTPLISLFNFGDSERKGGHTSSGGPTKKTVGAPPCVPQVTAKPKIRLNTISIVRA